MYVLYFLQTHVNQQQMKAWINGRYIQNDKYSNISEILNIQTTKYKQTILEFTCNNQDKVHESS